MTRLRWKLLAAMLALVGVTLAVSGLFTRQVTHEQVRRLLVASVIAGLMFLCLPADLGFADRTDAGIWQPIYDAIYRIDNRFDTVPSFHVIYTASILLAFMAVATPRLRRIYLI